MLLCPSVSIFQNAVLLSHLRSLLTSSPLSGVLLCAAVLANFFPNPLPAGSLLLGSRRLEGRRRAEGMTFLFVLHMASQGNTGQLWLQPLASFDTWSTAILCLLRGTYTNWQYPLRGLSTSCMAPPSELLVPVMRSTLPFHAIFW